MALPFANKYQQSKNRGKSDKKYDSFGFPNPYRNPSDKDSEYHYQWCSAIYARYVRNETGFKYEDRIDYGTLRAYGQGKQNTEIYKDRESNDVFNSVLTNQQQNQGIIGNGIDNTGNFQGISKQERAGWKNIDFKPVSPAPKIRTAIQGMLRGTELHVYADAIDAINDNEKKKNKWRAYAESQDLPWINELLAGRGIDIQEPTVDFTDKESFESFEASGGFRPNIARVIEKILDKTWDMSRWEDFLKEKILDDFIDLNKASIKEYYDTEELRYKIRYVDPADLIIQYSKDHNYEDSEYAGEIRRVKVSVLRAKGVPEEKLAAAARQYIGFFDNDSYGVNNFEFYDNYNSESGYYGYDEFYVLVADCEWIDIDTEKRLRKRTKKGQERYLEVDYNYEAKKLSDKDISKGLMEQVENVNVRQVRKASWIVGTEIVYDWGKANFVARPNKMKPTLSYHAISLPGESIIWNILPYLDQYMLAWLRFQNDSAQAIPKGAVLDVGMLQNVFNSQNDADFLNLIKLYKDTGVLLYKQSPSGQYQGGNPVPVTPTDGGVGAAFNEFIQAIQIINAEIENMTGLNSIALGSTPGERTGKGVTEISLAGSNNVLRPLLDSVFEFKKKSAETLVKRIPLAINYDSRIADAYRYFLSDQDIEVLKQGIVDDAVFAFEWKYRPDDQDKADLNAYLQIALENGRAGQPDGINILTAMDIREKLNNGGLLDDVRNLLKYEMKKYNKELERRQAQNVEQQNQAILQQQQQAAQISAQEKDAEFQANVQLKNLDHQHMLEQIAAKADADFGRDLDAAAYKQDEQERAYEHEQKMNTQNNKNNA